VLIFFTCRVLAEAEAEVEVEAPDISFLVEVELDTVPVCGDRVRSDFQVRNRVQLCMALDLYTDAYGISLRGSAFLASHNALEEVEEVGEDDHKVQALHGSQAFHSTAPLYNLS